MKPGKYWYLLDHFISPVQTGFWRRGRGGLVDASATLISSLLFISSFICKGFFYLKSQVNRPQNVIYILRTSWLFFGWKHRSLILCILDTASSFTATLEVNVEIYILLDRLSSGLLLLLLFIYFFSRFRVIYCNSCSGMNITVWIRLLCCHVEASRVAQNGDKISW